MEHIIMEILAEILDIASSKITLDTYVIRDLGAESIDLMEVAVTINDKMGIEVVEDDIFLRRLREFLMEADQAGALRENFLAVKYSFLSSKRIEEILSELGEGPVLKVGDLIDYVRTQKS